MTGLVWALLAIIAALAFALVLIDSAYHDLKASSALVIAQLRAERAERAERTFQRWEDAR